MATKMERPIGEMKPEGCFREKVLPKIGIEDKNLQDTGVILCRIVADLFVIDHKLKTNAYNVLGEKGYMYKKLFDELAFEVWNNSKLTSEYLRGIGHRVPNFSEIYKHSRINLPKEGTWPTCEEMLKDTVNDFENFLRFLGEDRKKVNNLKDYTTESWIFDLEKKFRVYDWRVRSLISCMDR